MQHNIGMNYRGKGIKRLGGWMGENKNKVWFSVLINSLFLGGMLLIYYPIYETNDDAGLLGLASGIKGFYDIHLVHINCFWGWIFNTLYKIHHDLPWYALAQYTLLFCAFTGITCVLLRMSGNRFPVCLVFVLLLIFTYEGYVKIQYTKTAGILAAAGFAMVFWALFQKSIPLKMYSSGFLLAVMGSMYRFNQFFCEAAIYTALGLCFLFRLKYICKEKNKRLLICLGTFLGLLVTVLAVRKIDRMMYSSERWEYYLAYDAARTELLDYGFPDFADNKEAYLALGIDKNTYKLFKKWTHSDNEKITVDVMEQIADLKEKKTINTNFLISYLKKVPKGFLKITGFWCFAVIFLCRLLRARGGAAERFVFLYEILVILGLYLYLFYRGRYLINRVDIGIWLAASIVLLWLFRPEKQSRFLKAELLLMAAMVIFTQYKWRGHLRVNNTDQAAKKQSNQEILEKIHADSEHLYLTKVGTVSFAKAYGVWDCIPFGIGDNMYPLGGWTAQTDTYLSILDQYQILNPFRDMINNERVYLIDNDIEMTLNYLRTWYNENAEAVLVEQIGNLSVYQIQAE